MLKGLWILERGEEEGRRERERREPSVPPIGQKVL